MMQKMNEWVQGLGNQRQTIMSRLTKENVREHRNIRASGEGGASSAEGGAAWNAAHNAQHQIGGYLNTIPGVSQAQSLFNQANSRPGQPGFGFREGSVSVSSGGSSYGYTGAPGMHGSVSEPVPVSSSGEAADYYTGGSGTRINSSVSEHHQGPPSFPSSSSYAPPSGPPPSFSSYPGPSGPPSHAGYAPSYIPPSGPPPPPAYGGPSFPNADAPGGGFAMPGASAFSGPGGAPGFPDHNAYAPPCGSYYGGPPPGGFPAPPRPPGGW